MRVAGGVRAVRERGRLRRSLIAFALGACASCAGGATRGPAQGDWSGEHVRFRVVGDRVTDLVALSIGCGTPGCAPAADAPLGDAVIVDRRFTAAFPAVTVAGTFDRDDFARGTFEIIPLDGCCHVLVPWTATLVGGLPVDCSARPRTVEPGSAATLGVGTGPSFRPLADGADLWLELGFQGLFMFVVSIEASGFDATGTTAAISVGAGGTTFGATSVTRPLWASTGTGAWRIEPLYLVATEPPDALRDRPATVHLVLDNLCGFVLTRDVGVTMRAP